MFVCNRGDMYYALLNTNELWRTTALIYVDNGQYYTVSRRVTDQGSYAKISHLKEKAPWYICKPLYGNLPLFHLMSRIPLPKWRYHIPGYRSVFCKNRRVDWPRRITAKL